MSIKHNAMRKTCLLLILGSFQGVNANNLPPNFVYLHDIDASILQEMRYAGQHNFVGRPVHGYEAKSCILTKPTALALAKVQQELKSKHLSLKVYDCYRPQRAVNDFIVWSKKPLLQSMKQEFYPRTNKVDFFKLGYVATKSGHSRGSTVDLTIVPIPTPKQENYYPEKKLVNCYDAKRFHDSSIEMGTGFDCMDETAHFNSTAVSKLAQKNRQFLQKIMMKNGFVPYADEWWHFTLKNEPYPKTYFNFLIR